jgi:hypothetical protein
MSRPMRMFAALIGLGALLGVCTPACSSATSSLCSNFCDCEHCNDDVNDIVCDDLDGQATVSKDYGCDSQFGDWVDCQNNSGVCNSEKATFSSLTPGQCNGPVNNTQEPCKTNADCMDQDSFCSNATCQIKTCGGMGGQSCKDNSDCPGGADLCATQKTALDSCIDNASADKKNDFDIGRIGSLTTSAVGN